MPENISLPVAGIARARNAHISFPIQLNRRGLRSEGEKSAIVAMAKILIVEDDEQIVAYISELLHNVGHTVSSAHSVPRARAVMEDEPDFALMILDHHLGMESGVHLLTEIRESERYRTLPVMVCSGDTKATAIKRFLTLQIAGFIVKPFQPGRLLAEVERILRLAKTRSAPAPESAPSMHQAVT